MARVSGLFVGLFTLTLCTFGYSEKAEARAPDTFEEAYEPPILIDTPMWLAFEIKVGPYSPGLTKGSKSAYRETFGKKDGWMLNLELDVTLWHIPYVGQLNV